MNPSTLTNEELDKLIHEKIMGKCWHEGENVGWCSKCKERWMKAYQKNPSYTTSWADYGKLLEKIRNSTKWSSFKYGSEELCRQDMSEFVDKLVDPRRGCEAIASYFCKEER